MRTSSEESIYLYAIRTLQIAPVFGSIYDTEPFVCSSEQVAGEACRWYLGGTVGLKQDTAVLETPGALHTGAKQARAGIELRAVDAQDRLPHDPTGEQPPTPLIKLSTELSAGAPPIKLSAEQ
jgi:hypothetical protein